MGNSQIINENTSDQVTMNIKQKYCDTAKFQIPQKFHITKTKRQAERYSRNGSSRGNGIRTS